MNSSLELISHDLCPYVQRAVIVASELDIGLRRTDIDLANKPDWFIAISPTGKVPLLRVVDAEGSQQILFESAAICEYLDETASRHLLPTEPLQRAHVRAWVEFASGTLSAIAGLYSASDAASFKARASDLKERFGQVEAQIEGPWFAGAAFGLVDAAFAPVFRYLDAFKALLGLDLVANLSKASAWRSRLAARPSVIAAVAQDYPEKLALFLRARQSHLGRLLEG
jgi:glutathione S-transferase